MTSVTSQKMRWLLSLAAAVAVAAGCSDSGGSGPNPDYSLAVSPASVTVVPGGGGSSTTVTIDRTDFTGEVTLSLGGAPAGVSGVFDPVATTGTTSTLTLSSGIGPTPGNYNIIVRGTASVGDHSRQIALTIDPPPPSFSLSLAGAALSIARGASNGTGVTLTRVDFSGPVTLSLSNAPAGVTWTFNPVAPTGNGSTLTVSVGLGATPGVYDLEVSGVGTPGSSSATLTLTVL